MNAGRKEERRKGHQAPSHHVPLGITNCYRRQRFKHACVLLAICVDTLFCAHIHRSQPSPTPTATNTSMGCGVWRERRVNGLAIGSCGGTRTRELVDELVELDDEE